MDLRLASRALTAALDNPTDTRSYYQLDAYHQQQHQHQHQHYQDLLGHSRIAVDSASVLIPTDLTLRVKAASSFLHSEQLTHLVRDGAGGQRWVLQ